MSTDSIFKKVLIANRGAIATRIIRTLKKLNISSVAVYHQQDEESLHVQQADEAICLGEGSAADTYLNIQKIIEIAKQTGAEAIHPGYGFLSENTDFVQRCEEEGIVFIGPTTEQMNLFGLKHQAREAAQQADVPLVPGSPLLTDLDSAVAWAADVGYPVILKSTAGGGGIGMQICEDEVTLRGAWDSVKRLSANYFSNDGVFLEKFIRNGRHLEVQIFGDGQGTAVSFGERDCSAQRRNQKVIEETPAPNLSDELRVRLHETAERLMASVNYRNAGTVEFIFDVDAQQFYFLEVNTRLQVEHGVTEQVWGVDLVECMVKQAAGVLDDLNDVKDALSPKGHSVQVRIYAEDPNQDFRPSAGLLSKVAFPEGFDRPESTQGLRIDRWIESGVEVPALFDPMLAKVIVTEADRTSAMTQLSRALSESEIYGIETNKGYLLELLKSKEAKDGTLLTRTLGDFDFKANTVQVLNAGTQTTIQDYPGRTGLWNIGVPPSGPMDHLNFRIANRLLNNPEDAAALEITLNGPTLKFYNETQIVLTGADLDASLDGELLPFYQTINVAAGQTLKLGKVKHAGARTYLAINGGIQCPDYLGSKSTFTLGQFGGHVGRALRVGDVLHLSEQINPVGDIALPEEQQPTIADHMELRVIYGPHGAPDFFTENDIEEFFSHEWEVHYNSSRTGVRLIGPKPEWARQSGGEAGMHPSNIHDNAYAFGTVDFTGDMPVILGPDGPSLGGFVCPATVIKADLWKLGQLKAGTKIKFHPVTLEQAVELEKQQNAHIAQLAFVEDGSSQNEMKELPSPIVYQSKMGEDDVVVRLAGDHFVLVEIGPLELDIPRRFKVHALMLWLEQHKKQGMEELTPGVRSLQIHYDGLQCNLATLLDLLQQALDSLSDEKNLKVPSRTVYLPLSWDDEACQLAIEKYMQSVRKDAPWCPSNLEFIRRINGLESIDDVKDIVFNARYLVMGLGDVYLGAPVATPLDPRHRLVTTKYNPARTWTAENSVGIGGAYMCVYGMEGPGGYQFVGRTLQMWNRYRQTDSFQQPWLLRFFDQIRFVEVSADELKQIRKDFPLGQYPLKVEEGEFSLEEYQGFIDNNQADIDEFQSLRQNAFDEELARWKANGQFTFEQMESDSSLSEEESIPENMEGVDSPVSGSVWQINVKEGETVQEGDVLMVLESMKMEIEVHATCGGKVSKLLKQQGASITAGQSLVWIE